MSFLRTSFWGGLSTGITMLAGLVTTKYVAVMIGPSGMAMMGQFSNLAGIAGLFATGACASGVVKYIAEYKDDTARRQLVSNALLLTLIGYLITGGILTAFSERLAMKTFQEPGYGRVMLIYGALLLFPAFNVITSSIFNGLMRIRLMSVINMIASGANVVIVIIAAKLFGIQGVLLANTISALLVSGIYFYFLKKSSLLPSNLVKPYNTNVVKLLLGFSAMGIVSGIIAPSLQLIVRSKLLQDFDSNIAGLWQANTRLSDYYLNFIYTVLGIYYLPKLSSISDPQLLKKEMQLGFLRIIPAVAVITLIIWFCRHFIVNVLLTNQFSGMLVLLKWQLIGDVIKIAAWLLGYLMVAKAMKKMFIATEIIFSSSFVLLNYWAIERYGLVGSAYAFVINYTLYLITLIITFRKTLF